jgi:monoamine oxidase
VSKCTDSMPRKKRLKIGIVGGGIAGMFCARDLAEKGHEIVLYEGLLRLGGRIETVPLSGFDAEVGPMRFELAIQKHLKELGRSLGIKFDDFTPPTSVQAEFPKYRLGAAERSAAEMRAMAESSMRSHSEILEETAFSHCTLALDLLRFGVYRIFNLEGRHFTLPEVIEKSISTDDGLKSRIEAYADCLVDSDYDFIRTEAEFELGGGQKVFLHRTGLWNVLTAVLSAGAITKIRDSGTFYHLISENPSASEWLIFWLRLFRSDAKLSTIKAPGGVYNLVSRLEQKLKESDSVTIHYNTSVNAVASRLRGGDKVTVSTVGNVVKKTGFDHVILALPPAPLLKLNIRFPPRILKYIKGVEQYPLLKICVTVKDPWWKELPTAQVGAHLLPTREIHYFDEPVTRAKDLGMIMLYMDRPFLSYWNHYVTLPHLKAQLSRPSELKAELARHIALLLPGDEARNQKRLKEQIQDWAIRDWSREPFEAAFHAWKRGIKVPQALKELQAFELESGESKNIHICGEAYSDYQAFVEGALRSASDVIATINSAT